MPEQPDVPDLPDPADLPVGEGQPSAVPATGERIGVYVCHCGGNISDVVDVDRVAQELGRDEDVAVARHVMFMCSDEGQQAITDDIRDLQLDRVIVAACTPKLHETTFRKTVIRGGMNPYLFLPANIREQVSWAHPHDHEAATDKAIAVVKAAVAKARLLQPLEMVRVSAVHRTLVIGAGVAGLRSALDLARQGLEVVLIEASPFLGGRTAQLHTVYPTEEPARPLVRRLIDQVLAEPRIDIRTSTQLGALSGYVGDFQATLRTEPRGVTAELVDAASALAACPVEVPDGFEQGLRNRKAIYRPYADAQPSLPAIDWASCTRCRACVVAAGEHGIDLEAEAVDAIVDVGAVIVASGYDHYQPSDGEYGYGRSDRVVTLPQLERMLDPEGPSGGRLLVDGRPPRTVVFIHCVGSRQIEGVDEAGPERAPQCLLLARLLHRDPAGSERGPSTVSRDGGRRPLPRHPDLREGPGVVLRRGVEAGCRVPPLRRHDPTERRGGTQR